MRRALRVALVASLVATSHAIAPPARAEAVPVLRATLRVVGAGQDRACRGVAGACTVETVAGARLELRVEPAGALAGRTVTIERAWRTPGASSLRGRAARRRTLGSERLALQLPASVAFGTAAGTWCVRASATDVDGAPVSAPPTCLRLRPPVEIGWAGDVVVGSSYGLPPNGGRDQLAAVEPLLRAPDLTIGNYEGTLSHGGSRRCSGGPLCFIFQGPPERARNLATAGFDVMSLANNHALDMGTGARRQTVEALRRVGIDAAGLPGAVTVEQVADTRVAIVGFSPYPGTTSMRDLDAVRDLVRAARRAGDVVVVTFHAGLEGAAGAHVPHGADYGTNTRAAVHAAIDAGADVVFGSGPHVVRGVERRHGALAFYSTGNFAGWHNFGLSRLTSQSGVVRVTLDHRGTTLDASWDPVVIARPGIPRPDRSGAVLDRVRSLTRADFGGPHAVRIGRTGRIRW
jgi:hypothetical protein